jgi:heme/copper-type cytochrome/quinol oxidase subunit 2
MHPYITAALVMAIVFGVVALIFTSKVVEGANAQQIAKGHATKSKDEIRREVRVARIVISALILVCLAVIATKCFILF